MGALVGVVHKAAAMSGGSIMQSLLQSIEDEARVCRPAHSPADDAASEGVNHQGDVDEALPGRDIGEIRSP